MREKLDRGAKCVAHCVLGSVNVTSWAPMVLVSSSTPSLRFRASNTHIKLMHSENNGSSCRKDASLCSEKLAAPLCSRYLVVGRIFLRAFPGGLSFRFG